MEKSNIISDIKKTVKKEFESTPEMRVARSLYTKGVTERYFYSLRKDLELPDDQFLSVSNELRNIEKGIK